MGLSHLVSEATLKGGVLATPHGGVLATLRWRFGHPGPFSSLSDKLPLSFRRAWWQATVYGRHPPTPAFAAQMPEQLALTQGPA